MLFRSKLVLYGGRLKPRRVQGSKLQSDRPEFVLIPRLRDLRLNRVSNKCIGLQRSPKLLPPDHITAGHVYRQCSPRTIFMSRLRYQLVNPERGISKPWKSYITLQRLVIEVCPRQGIITDYNRLQLVVCYRNFKSNNQKCPCHLPNAVKTLHKNSSCRVWTTRCQAHNKRSATKNITSTQQPLIILLHISYRCRPASITASYSPFCSRDRRSGTCTLSCQSKLTLPRRGQR